MASSTAAEYGQDQRQRERADVHAAQAVAGQRTLLVFAVRRLHGQRVGSQRARHAAARASRSARRPQSARGRCAAHGPARARAGRTMSAAVLRRPGSPLRWRCRSPGPGAAARASGRSGGPTPAPPPALSSTCPLAPTSDTVAARRSARASAPAPAARRCSPPSASRSAATRDLPCRSVGQAWPACSCPAPGRIQRAGHLDVEPGLDAARGELVGHGVDHQPRQQPDERRRCPPA